MQARQIRSILFPLHRYLGLVVGLILIIVGVTGSLLVFSHELQDRLIVEKFGAIAPQETLVSIDQVFNAAQTFIQQVPGYSINGILFPQHPGQPYQARLWKDDQLIQLFIHPHNGNVLGTLSEQDSWITWILRLHYQLLAGDTGLIVVGVAGFLMTILGITGTALWPGWRRLVMGFKIKWNAHPKRRNFDIHKVAGIIAAVFLILTGFTGFCWNFYAQSTAVIKAITFTPAEPAWQSKALPNQKPLPLSDLLARSNQALPGAATIFMALPSQPDGVVRVGKRQTHETNPYGQSNVILDAYSGQVLRVNDSRRAALGDRILNSFGPLHFGTFGGLWTRWLYVLVGLSPIALLWTGVRMWQYRKKPSPPAQGATDAP
jgi:uncharacterized iron-regulated membrane protein